MPVASALRPFTPADADAVTALLHDAYSEHLDVGLNFTAATQPAALTRKRAGHGGCWVIEQDGAIVATAAVSLPPSHSLQRLTPVAAEPQTAWLNQFAVAPDHRGSGLASTLFTHGAGWARAQGMTTIGIDTARPATGLIALYEHWGFAHRDTIHWDGKTYDSVVMVRAI